MSAEHGAGPRPGDPRSRGPRPPATWRDAGWALLALTLGAITVWQFVRLAVVVLTRELPVSTGGLVLAFLITVAWLLTVYWFVAGAWRRSVWGCPFEHDAAVAWERRCGRHELVDVPVGEPGPGSTA